MTGRPNKKEEEVSKERLGTPSAKNTPALEPGTATSGLWQGHRRPSPCPPDSQIIHGQHFHSELLVITKMEGRNLGLNDALALTSRLRDAAMSHCPVTPPPAWLGGHEPETGKPTRMPHTAFLALPFVGCEYADGHIMGLALALPARHFVSAQEPRRLLGPLFYDDNHEPREIELRLGSRGVWKLRLEERQSPPLSLMNETWTGPGQTWASVTPVVLDRFPKPRFAEERLAWDTEARNIISQSCVRAGLPSPEEIDLDTTAWHTGVPRADANPHALRTQLASNETLEYGDGFPRMPSRSGKPCRPQIHAILRFAQPVLGPILIGAGRFLGYGLFKPHGGDERNP
jgi:CRISPR-associated protein Csb2